MPTYRPQRNDQNTGLFVRVHVVPVNPTVLRVEEDVVQSLDIGRNCTVNFRLNSAMVNGFSSLGSEESTEPVAQRIERTVKTLFAHLETDEQSCAGRISQPLMTYM